MISNQISNKIKNKLVNETMGCARSNSIFVAKFGKSHIKSITNIGMILIINLFFLLVK